MALRLPLHGSGQDRIGFAVPGARRTMWRARQRNFVTILGLLWRNECRMTAGKPHPERNKRIPTDFRPATNKNASVGPREWRDQHRMAGVARPEHLITTLTRRNHGDLDERQSTIDTRLF